MRKPMLYYADIGDFCHNLRRQRAQTVSVLSLSPPSWWLGPSSSPYFTASEPGSPTVRRFVFRIVTCADRLD